MFYQLIVMPYNNLLGRNDILYIYHKSAVYKKEINDLWTVKVLIYLLQKDHSLIMFCNFTEYILFNTEKKQQKKIIYLFIYPIIVAVSNKLYLLPVILFLASLKYFLKTKICIKDNWKYKIINEINSNLHCSQ